MVQVNWSEILGWNEEQLEELRFSGFSFLREGHYRKALLFFEALAVLNPKSHYDTQTLGAIYLQLGKNDKALKTINRALELDPKHEPTLLNKAKALFSLGNTAEATLLARGLEKSGDLTISDDAAALIAAFH